MTSKTTTLIQQAESVTPGGVNTSIRRVEPTLVWNRARGSKIWDTDGKEYIDYHAAFGPIILGHAHSHLLEKICQTLGNLDLIGCGTTELEIQLAEKIVQHVPCAEQVLFCNSGSEATYSAIRLSRAVTGRNRLIKFQGCFHGWHDYVCMNIISPAEKIGKYDPASSGILREAMEHTIVLPFNDLDAIEDAFREYPDQIAAIILEPIPHNIGCVLPKAGYLQGLRELSRKNGSILIFDEVITGFRHNLGGYQKICGVTPDLTTLGKSLGNGYPIAAICGRLDLMKRFATHEDGDVLFAGTYNAHPIGTTAALSTIEDLEKPGAYEQLFRLGDRIRRGLKEIMERAKIPHFVTGFGSIFLTYFMEPPVEQYADLLRNDSALQVRYRQAAIERGVYKLPLNLKRSHISLSHTEAEIDQSLDVFEAAIKEVTQSLAV